MGSQLPPMLAVPMTTPSTASDGSGALFVGPDVRSNRTPERAQRHDQE